MAKVLIAFSSSEGQTEKVAHFVAHLAAERQIGVVLLNVDHQQDISVENVDAAILAGAVHAGVYADSLQKCAEINSRWLSQIPSLFLSISLTAASRIPTELARAEALAEAFLGAVGLREKQIELVGGALHLNRYGSLKRRILCRLAEQSGLDFDPVSDTEFTNWPALGSSVSGFLSQVA